MKLTQDVRDVAASQAETEAGMVAKAEEFRKLGGELYVPAK